MSEMPEQVAWVLGMFGSMCLILICAYMRSLQKTTDRIEQKVDQINGDVRETRESQAAMKAEIRSLKSASLKSD